MAIKKLPSTGDRPQHSPTATGLPHGMSAGGSTDSAGLPWEGRNFNHHETAFADDDGSTPRKYQAACDALKAAAVAYRESRAAADPKTVGSTLKQLAVAETELLTELSKIRVLVPLVAEGGDFGLTDSGKVVEKTQELSIVTVSAPDGRSVMPIFTSTAAMRAWDPTARPIPVPAPQAFVAAAQEQTPLVVIDPAVAETRIGIRGTRFEQIATGNVKLPAWADPEFEQRLLNLVRSTIASVVAISLVPADPGMDLTNVEAQLIVALEPNLTREKVSEIAAEISSIWESSELLRSRLDSIALKFVPAA